MAHGDRAKTLRWNSCFSPYLDTRYQEYTRYVCVRRINGWIVLNATERTPSPAKHHSAASMYLKNLEARLHATVAYFYNKICRLTSNNFTLCFFPCRHRSSVEIPLECICVFESIHFNREQVSHIYLEESIVSDTPTCMCAMLANRASSISTQSVSAKRPNATVRNEKKWNKSIIHNMEYDLFNRIRTRECTRCFVFIRNRVKVAISRRQVIFVALRNNQMDYYHVLRGCSQYQFDKIRKQPDIVTLAQK